LAAAGGHQSYERFSAMAVENCAGHEQKYSKCGRMDMAFVSVAATKRFDFIFSAPQTEA